MVKKFSAKKVGDGILGFLQTANAALEQVPNGVLAYFDAIGELGETASQAWVDKLCRYAAWMVNVRIERIRQYVIKGVYEQNKAIKLIVDGLNTAKKVMEDPLGVIPSMFSFITSPFSSAIQMMVSFAEEIAKLAANLSRIMQVLPPSPPNPNINFNEFKLQVGSFSMGALGSADSLPDPEVMFPKPESPFGKNAFKDSYAQGVDAFNEGKTQKKIIYAPNYNADKTNGKSAMEGEIA